MSGLRLAALSGLIAYNAVMNDKLRAYVVLEATYNKKERTYRLKISPDGIDDPTLKKELILIKSPRGFGNRTAYFRGDDDWYVQGFIRKGEISLFKDDG